MILPTTMLPQIGDRITDHAAPPDESAIREWIGPQAFGHWAELRSWIDEFYPAVFEPDWLYGGRNRGWSLRYKKTKAFTTLVPAFLGWFTRHYDLTYPEQDATPGAGGLGPLPKGQLRVGIAKRGNTNQKREPTSGSL